MSWQLQLGIDTNLLKKADPVLRDRQIRMLSILSIMLIVIGLICTISTVVFTLLIFHHWLIAIVSGLFMGLVAFNLYRLLVMTAMDASGTVLGDYMRDHEKHIYEQVDREADLRTVSEERILDMVVLAKQQLREKPVLDKLKSGQQTATILTMFLRVIMLCIMALIFAAGIEILLFKEQINAVFETLKGIYLQGGDRWMVEQVLTPPAGDQFYIIHANSLLLILDVLTEGLGYWKLLLDLLFMILFLIPLAIVFRSRELAGGEYIKEWVLSAVSISYYHHLTTNKYCQQLATRFKEEQSSVSTTQTNAFSGNL